MPLWHSVPASTLPHRVDELRGMMEFLAYEPFFHSEQVGRGRGRGSWPEGRHADILVGLQNNSYCRRSAWVQLRSSRCLSSW